MPANTKTIQRRIKSVTNTRKITKAMEMVAAAKMRRAVEAALNTREYATLAWDLLVNLSKNSKQTMPLLQTRAVKKLLVILITSNRGLCGSFNSNIIKKISAELRDPINISRHRIGGTVIEPSKNMEIEILGAGRKGAVFAKKNNFDLIASFTDISDTPRLEDVLSICEIAIEDFMAEKYDKVVVAYTDYVSAISQAPKLRQVLPVSEVDLEKMIQETGKDGSYEPNKIIDISDYVFEPNKDHVLNIILPRLVESQIYQAMLESSASEHSARMMAMRNASDAAGEMIDDLTLTFNKARQASITQEIAEIASGAAALE